MSVVDETYSRGRRLVVEQPMAILVGLVAILLIVDLLNQLITGRLPVSQLLLLLWRGVVNGLIIGLAGVGLSMTYSILNFANFAHGDYITSGAFAGWAATYVVAGLGLSNITLGSLLLVGASGDVFPQQLGTSITQSPVAIALGVVLAGLFAIVLALILDRIVYKPMRGEGGIALLIASIGVAFALRYLVVFVWGQSVRSVTSNPPSYPVPGLPMQVGAHELTVVVAAIVLMLAVHFLLQQTKLGKAMRAMADNKDLARVTGIPTERVIKWTWIIGAGLAGVAGYLLILEAGTIAYNRGWLLLLPIFAAVILGGIGSVYGAIYGGLIIGFTEAVAVIWIPTDFARAAAFAIMIIVLLFKPQGLFAGRMTA